MIYNREDCRQKCGNCRYVSKTKNPHLIKCLLGRDVLRTVDSWCGVWTAPLPKRPIWSEL
jgi:hypothetical protein